MIQHRVPQKIVRDTMGVAGTASLYVCAGVESKTEAGVARNLAYHLYGVERYNTFREYASDKIEEEPGWHNAGVEYLRRTQAKDGSWNSQPQNAPVVDTALSTLFLLRSSKAVVQRLVVKTGILNGGERLPGDLLKVEAKGRVVAIDPTNSTGDLSGHWQS